MPISSKSLREHIQRRSLVSLRRAKIDSHLIQGFVLAYSKSLLLLQHVYDFHLDGLMLLRRKDLTELKASKTDRFQRQLLLAEGALEQVDFNFRAPIQSYTSFLAACSPHEIVIVEDESSEPQTFLIGTVSRVRDETAVIRHFDGVGRIVEPHKSISTDQITSCQIRTHYIRFYQRHFERVEQSPARRPNTKRRAAKK